MNTIYKIIFWFAIAFIILNILFSIARSIFDLEFVSQDAQSFYESFLFLTIPIAILLTLFGTLKSKNNESALTLKIIGTSFVAFAVAFIILFSAFSNMCAYFNKQILYEFKTDPNTKIIIREFGCGATDSGPNSVGVYKVQFYTKHFIYATPIDTTLIDINKWNKIN